jgi:hypothetical protein
MTDEQMKADLRELEMRIGDERMFLGRGFAADALQRIHDALSARLADAVQPAAGEGGLREALDELLTACEDDAGVPNEGDEDDEPVGISSSGPMSLTFGMMRRARAALSTSVPAGEVDVQQEQETFDHWWETSGRKRSYDVFAEQAAYASWRERGERIAPPAQEPTR